MSAIERLFIECDIMRSAARMSRGPHIDTLNDARTELAALRRRVEDAELLMRHALHFDLCEDGYWISHNEHSCTIIVGEEEDGEPIEMDLLMRDGLPILTDEARAALRGKETT